MAVNVGTIIDKEYTSLIICHKEVHFKTRVKTGHQEHRDSPTNTSIVFGSVCTRCIRSSLLTLTGFHLFFGNAFVFFLGKEIQLVSLTHVLVGDVATRLVIVCRGVCVRINLFFEVLQQGVSVLATTLIFSRVELVYTRSSTTKFVLL